jgi:hypothetical protein
MPTPQLPTYSSTPTPTTPPKVVAPISTSPIDTILTPLPPKVVFQTPTPTPTPKPPIVMPTPQLPTYSSTPTPTTTPTTTPIPTTTTPPTITEPTFPNWDTLDCMTLQAEIDSLNSIISGTKFDSVKLATIYNNELAKAKDLFGKKCSVPTPTTAAPKPMGGGGGGAMPPKEESPKEEEQQPKPQVEVKKNNTWLWVLLAIVGGVILFSGKNKSNVTT